MQHSQDADTVALDVVHEEVMSVRDELARAFYTSDSAGLGMLDEQRGLPLEQLVQVAGRHGIVIRNVVEDRVTIGNRTATM